MQYFNLCQMGKGDLRVLYYGASSRFCLVMVLWALSNFSSFFTHVTIILDCYIVFIKLIFTAPSATNMGEDIYLFQLLVCQRSKIMQVCVCLKLLMVVYHPILIL